MTLNYHIRLILQKKSAFLINNDKGVKIFKINK
jgi:hypothetical protein